MIPYIAELIDTRLIQGLDARGQRLDVANTISYRRRKGTVGAAGTARHDITGWDAKVVEFFRRLGAHPPPARSADRSGGRRAATSPRCTRPRGWSDR